jgi:hypothetical protein
MTEIEQDQKSEPTLEPLLQAHIGKQLRTMYDAMTREPVPERFKLLLDQLEAGEAPGGAAPGQNDARAGADEAGAA